MKINETQGTFFTSMEFESEGQAREMLGILEEKLVKNKLGLKIAAVAQVLWFVTILLGNYDIVCSIAAVLALGATVGAYVFGGGFGKALLGVIRGAGKIAFWGWILVPFPINLATGFAASICVLVYVPLFFVFVPIYLVGKNYFQIRKNIKEAEAYLGFVD